MNFLIIIISKLIANRIKIKIFYESNLQNKKGKYSFEFQFFDVNSTFF